MKAIFVLIIGCCLLGCPPSPKPPVVDASDASLDVGDAGPQIDATAVVDAAVDPDEAPDGTVKNKACAAACAKMKALGCPEAVKPDGGQTCYNVCAHAESSGKFSLKPDCVASKNTIEELKTCGTVRCKK